MQVTVFLTAYQLLSDSNRLAVLASANAGTEVLYSDLALLVDAAADRPEPSAAVAVASGLQKLLGASNLRCPASELSSVTREVSGHALLTHSTQWNLRVRVVRSPDMRR